MTSTEELYEQLQILHQDALEKLITFRLDETWKGLSQIEHIITQAEYHATRAPVTVTDEMIELGAEALRKHHCDDDSNFTRWAYEEDATVVLEAALGGGE